MIAKTFGLVFTLPDDLKDLYLNVFKNDLAQRNGETSWRLPLPARFVIDRGGIIRYAQADPDYTVRPEPEGMEVPDAGHEETLAAYHPVCIGRFRDDALRR